MLLVPVQVSARSHSFTAARQTVPVFPAGCVQAGEPTVPLHTSVVQTLPSSVQAVPADLTASAGHVVLEPVQVSARSHSFTAPRQTVPAALRASAGHAALDPVQFSAASHRSTAGRQTVLDDRKASPGQAAVVPVQFSATSQTPADARHTVLDGRKASAGQAAVEPEQVSAASQAPAAVRQIVPLGCKPSGGQLVLEPSQVSATSQAPAEARQPVPALPAACWQILLLPLQRSVVHGLPSSVQAVPLVLNAQVDEQHEAAVPLAAPSSHCSPVSTAPFPHSVYVTVIRTESTDPTGLVLFPFCAESAAPKLAELFMSDAVHEVLQRSAEPPCATKVSVAGQPAVLDLSAVPTVPPLTIRTALSVIVPALAFLYSHST